MRTKLFGAVAVVILFIGQQSSAGLSQFPKGKLVDFLKKTRACRVAVSSVSEGIAVNPVYCVWDGIANPGSIHEFKGCFLGRYDVQISEETKRYSPLFDAGAAMSGRSQPNGPCTRDLILKMLTVYPVSDFLSFGKSPEPFLVSLKQQPGAGFEVLYDPEKILTASVLAKINAWKAPKPKSIFPPMTKERLPPPEKNEACTPDNLMFAQDKQHVWECAKQQDLELEACDIIERIAAMDKQHVKDLAEAQRIEKESGGKTIMNTSMSDSSVQMDELEQLAEVYQARFRKNPPEKCSPEDLAAFRKKRGY